MNMSTDIADIIRNIVNSDKDKISFFFKDYDVKRDKNKIRVSRITSNFSLEDQLYFAQKHDTADFERVLFIIDTDKKEAKQYTRGGKVQRIINY